VLRLPRLCSLSIVLLSYILSSPESEWPETTWLMPNLAWMSTRAVDLTHLALARTVKVRVTLMALKFNICIGSCAVHRFDVYFLT
jgi:hypothetical protein